MAIKLKVNEEQKKLDEKYNNAVINKETDIKKEKATFKYEMVSSKTGLEKARKILFIISCVSTFIMINVGLAPVLTAVFAVIMFFAWIMFIILITGVSAGLLWINEGVRKFNTNFINLWRNLFDKPQEIIDNILPKVMPYFAALCGAIAIASLVLSTLCFIKQRKGNTAVFIISIILLIITIVFIIIGFSYAYVKK